MNTVETMKFTKRDLVYLDTIEQAWDGSELKVEDGDVRIWLNPCENRAYDGDYTLETRINGKWFQTKCYFE